MSRRNDRQRAKARKARNEAYVEELLTRPVEPRKRWQGGKVDLKFGRHPDAVWHVEFSGVRVPVVLDDPKHMDGVVDLTRLALDAKPDVN